MFQNKIYSKIIETPLGEVLACATGQGICLLEFTDCNQINSEIKDLEVKFGTNVFREENHILRQLEEELAQYFDRQLTDFEVPTIFVGTLFQRSVWATLRKIPYGTTWSYKKQAIVLGDIKKVRAVANANGMNKISILIPCHRVIASGGSLSGYKGGVWRKQRLLELENAILL